MLDMFEDLDVHENLLSIQDVGMMLNIINACLRLVPWNVFGL